MPGIYDITTKNYSAISSLVYKNLSHEAYLNSSKDFSLGNFGAGIGAVAGTHKGEALAAPPQKLVMT